MITSLYSGNLVLMREEIRRSKIIPSGYFHGRIRFFQALANEIKSYKKKRIIVNYLSKQYKRSEEKEYIRHTLPNS